MKRNRNFLPILALGVILMLGSGPLAAQSPSFEIIGAGEELEENIRAHVTLPDLACDVGGYRLARNLPGIRQNIIRAGRALGFYHLTHVTRFDRNEDCWVLRSEIEPGQPVRIGEVNIEVSGDREFFTSPLSNVPLQPGDQLNQSEYESIKSNLSAEAIEHGFFDARYEQSELRLDLVENTADININFNPGPRYRLGEINIQQLDDLSPEFIQRFMTLEEGEFYSSESLLEVRNALSSSLYFDNVSVTPGITRAQNGRVPVDVALGMRPRNMYGVGAGINTDIGPRLRLDYEDRYLNRQGHSVRANAGISPIQQNIDVSYRIPLEEPATESLRISGGFLAEDTDIFRSTTTKLGATYSYINSWDWRQEFFVDVQHDESNISGEKIVTDLVIPGVSITRTRADDALVPNSGWHVFAEVKGASDRLLSSETFSQLNIAGKLIETFGPVRFLGRFYLGTTAVDDTESIPVSLRYFAGGDQSVRGYKYESLGPVNEAGDVIGGKHEITTSLEVDFTVARNWRLALFVDTGNAFDAFDDVALRTGAGFGVRWLSPVGPIRVDLASALDNDNKLRLHITMGPDL